MDLKNFIEFINSSPSSYHAISSCVTALRAKGQVNADLLEKGRCFVFTKETSDGACLVAVDIGEEISNDSKFKIIASHADSPWFKLLENAKKEKDKTIEGYNLLKTKKYGGPILDSWLDRPLTIAGRVKVKTASGDEYKLVHLKNNTIVIPNICAHFMRFANNKELIAQGYPVLGTESTLKPMICKELGVKEDSILSFDLNTISKIEPVIWGDNGEFLSGQRLDNLVSVYTSLEAFLHSHDKKNINVLYIADNEEIGSDTEVGAKSKFLDSVLFKVIKDFKLNKSKVLNKSFMISADNAQSINPYFTYLFNPKFKVHPNKGLAVKFSKKYTSTKKSAKAFYKLCKDNNLPYQIYKNRKDIKGGGTLGKIVQSHLNIDAVDVGVPQLSMHSTFETVGTKDLETTIKTFECFYKG